MTHAEWKRVPPPPDIEGIDEMAYDDSAWHLDKKVPILFIVALVTQTIGFVYFGTSWKEAIDHRMAAQEKVTAIYSPIVDALVKSQIQNEQRLKIGEEVRATRVPMLDAMNLSIGVINSRLDAVSKAIVESREVNGDTIVVIRELSREVSNLREAVAGLRGALQPGRKTTP